MIYTVSAKTAPLSSFENFQNIASFAQLQFKGMNNCTFSTKMPILVKISATVIVRLTFNKWFLKVYRFKERAFHDVSIDHSPCPREDYRCWVVKLQISYHLCNGLQTALISRRWTMQSGASCRSAFTERESVERLAKEWSRFDHTSPCCSYSVASSFVCVCEGGQGTFWTLFMTIDEWSHCFIRDNRTCSLCCHGNLCFWRVIENM